VELERYFDGSSLRVGTVVVATKGLFIVVFTAATVLLFSCFTGLVYQNIENEATVNF